MKRILEILQFLFPEWMPAEEVPEPPEPDEGKDPDPVDWKQFRDFLKSPAWRELRAEAVAEINELNLALPPDKMGHDEIMARGIREYVKARIHYYFIELPDVMLDEKLKKFDEGDGSS